MLSASFRRCRPALPLRAPAARAARPQGDRPTVSPTICPIVCPSMRPTFRATTRAAALALAAAGALAGAAAPARAAEGMYLIVSAGPSKVKVSCGSASPCDTGGNGFKLLLGQRSPANVALEGGVWNFGKASVGTASAKVDGYGITAALHDDFHPGWTAAGRVGIASLKGSGAALSSRNTTPIYGFSLGARLTQQITLEGAIDAARPKFNGQRVPVQMIGVHIALSF